MSIRESSSNQVLFLLVCNILSLNGSKNLFPASLGPSDPRSRGMHRQFWCWRVGFVHSGNSRGIRKVLAWCQVNQYRMHRAGRILSVFLISEAKPGFLPIRPVEKLIRQIKNTIIIMRLAHCHVSMCQAEILACPGLNTGAGIICEAFSAS